jgi:nucleotide-binding universal stress UspA family protein
LAKIHHSYLYLIRVLHFHTRDELSYETKKAKIYLNNKVKIFEAEGISCEGIIEYGEPENVIIEKSKELKIDLIAMATHGHNWITDILFGSVAHKVRHTVSIPVLMIKKKE